MNKKVNYFCFSVIFQRKTKLCNNMQYVQIYIEFVKQECCYQDTIPCVFENLCQSVYCP